MMTLPAVFWMLVILFGLIGGFRGWAKETLVLFSLILALFILYVLERYVPGVKVALESQNGAAQVTIRAVFLVLLAYFGYQSPNIPALSSKLTRDKLQDWLLGSVLGMLNGYFLWGSLWYYIDKTGYPFESIIHRPAIDVSRMLAYMPPQILGEPYIFFAIAAAFVFVIVVFI
jgi:uncharacterized membrane protein required for colicin V production